jgi:hypothetical protein
VHKEKEEEKGWASHQSPTLHLKFCHQLQNRALADVSIRETERHARRRESSPPDRV